MDLTNDNMNECFDDDNKEFHQNLPEQTPTVSAEDYDLGSQDFDSCMSPRADVRPVEPEDVGAGAFSFQRPDECDDEAEPEEELEGFDGGDASSEMSSERLGSRLCKMVESTDDDMRKLFQKNEESVLGLTTLRDLVLEHEQQLGQRIEHGKRMLLDTLGKYSEESE
ncbi:uncharacterized protein LOC119442952 [Dermacentor silvarum]|uniref:uncharacterized protein LOC119442952 n=1 Tax=Dermacentor silvarum TaxID=543639 RepID=UPI002101052D|nr:uncharacterized protein LOC119442952 [Dermacentor silvarum]